MDTKGIRITGKDIGFIITILVMVVGFFVKFEVMQKQVEENTRILNENPPTVIVTNQKNMSDDIGEIKDSVKELVKAWNEWLRSQ